MKNWIECLFGGDKEETEKWGSYVGYIRVRGELANELARYCHFFKRRKKPSVLCNGAALKHEDMRM